MGKDQIIKAIMTELAVAYNQPLDPSRVRIFAQYLDDIGGDALRYAVAEHIKANKWYPSIAELRALAATYKVVDSEPVMMCREGEKLKRDADISGDISRYRRHVTNCRICGGTPMQYQPMPAAVKDQLNQLLKRKGVRNVPND